MSLYTHTHTHISFIHSSVDRHMCWFHFLTIVNDAAMNIVCMYLLKLVFLFFLDVYLGVELLGHIIALFLAF